jgi:hypothetical protein
VDGGAPQDAPTRGVGPLDTTPDDAVTSDPTEPAALAGPPLAPSFDVRTPSGRVTTGADRDTADADGSDVGDTSGGHTATGGNAGGGTGGNTDVSAVGATTSTADAGVATGGPDATSDTGATTGSPSTAGSSHAVAGDDTSTAPAPLPSAAEIRRAVEAARASGKATSVAAVQEFESLVATSINRALDGAGEFLAAGPRSTVLPARDLGIPAGLLALFGAYLAVSRWLDRGGLPMAHGSDSRGDDVELVL